MYIKWNLGEHLTPAFPSNSLYVSAGQETQTDSEANVPAEVRKVFLQQKSRGTGKCIGATKSYYT